MRLGIALAAILCTLILAFVPPNARGSSIGVYFDEGSDCDTSQLPFEFSTWYIVAKLSGSDAASSGIKAAAFRITGVPNNWIHFVFPPPDFAAPPTGNVFEEGIELLFPTCRAPDGVYVVYTITTLPTSQIDDLVYGLQAPLLPQYAGLQSPVLRACDPPSFTRVCVPGTPGYVNGRPCDAPNLPPEVVCPVAVEPRSWSSVKILYVE